MRSLDDTVPAEATAPQNGANEPFACVAPKELALWWKVSRSQVDRIAQRAGFRRLCLGEGRNGAVRYLLHEVEKWEREQIQDPVG